MEIKEITNKEEWESFLLACKEKTFLDSWNWGEFQKKTEDKIWRLGVYDGNNLMAVALVIKVKAKRGTFLFIPHGPVCNVQKDDILRILTEKLKELAKQEKAIFIRIAPIWERNEENKGFFKGLGYEEAPIHMHPEVTWELDISGKEEDLLSRMRKTTRYLIRQAEKDKDIEIVKSNDLDKFSDLLDKTASRHNFVPFSKDYLKNQFSEFAPDNQIVLYLGKYKNEIVSAAVVVYWQNIGFYHHGASVASKAPVSYLMQWEAIKEAKNRACLKYNFWGIAENEEDKKHPWHGLTLFKKGFGGERKEHVKTKDLPLSPIYRLTWVFETFRKKKRHL